jgi:hypothetical protein
VTITGWCGAALQADQRQTVTVNSHEFDAASSFPTKIPTAKQSSTRRSGVPVRTPQGRRPSWRRDACDRTRSVRLFPGSRPGLVESSNTSINIPTQDVYIHPLARFSPDDKGATVVLAMLPAGQRRLADEGGTWWFRRDIERIVVMRLDVHGLSVADGAQAFARYAWTLNVSAAPRVTSQCRPQHQTTDRTIDLL